MARGRMDGMVGRMQGPINGPRASGVRHPTQSSVPGGADASHGSGQPPPSALPVDDRPAQADLAIVEDDGLAGGDGPLRLCKAHLDA